MVGCIHLVRFPVWAYRWLAKAQGSYIVVHQDRVLSATPDLDRRGVVVGMSATRALGVAPHAAVYPSDPILEQHAQEALFRTVHGWTPFIREVGQGHFFFNAEDLEPLDDWCAAHRVPMGWARSQPLAELAALRAQPGRILRITESVTGHFFDRYPTERLRPHIIPHDIVDRLALFGLRTLGHIRRHLTPKQLTDQFGGAITPLLHYLWPKPDVPIPISLPPARLFITSDDFTEPITQTEDLTTYLPALAQRAETELASREAWRLDVYVAIRQLAEPISCTRYLRTPIRTANEVIGPAQQALAHLLADLPHAEIEPYSLAIALSVLRTPEATQVHVFRAAQPGWSALAAAFEANHPGTFYQVQTTPDAVFEEDQVHYLPIT